MLSNSTLRFWCRRARVAGGWPSACPAVIRFTVVRIACSRRRSAWPAGPNSDRCSPVPFNSGLVAQDRPGAGTRRERPAVAVPAGSPVAVVHAATTLGRLAPPSVTARRAVTVSRTGPAAPRRPAPRRAPIRRGSAAATARSHGRRPGRGCGEAGARRWPGGRRPRGRRAPGLPPGGRRPRCAGCAGTVRWGCPPVATVPGCWSIPPMACCAPFGPAGGRWPGASARPGGLASWRAKDRQDGSRAGIGAGSADPSRGLAARMPSDCPALATVRVSAVARGVRPAVL